MPGQRLVPLNLYYSSSRDDNFLTTTQCDECEGLYTFVRVEVGALVGPCALVPAGCGPLANTFALLALQGYVYNEPCTGCVNLTTYYNGKVKCSRLREPRVCPGARVFKARAVSRVLVTGAFRRVCRTIC